MRLLSLANGDKQGLQTLALLLDSRGMPPDKPRHDALASLQGWHVSGLAGHGGFAMVWTDPTMPSLVCCAQSNSQVLGEAAMQTLQAVLPPTPPKQARPV